MRCALVLLVGIFMTACVGTESGNPPQADALLIEVELDESMNVATATGHPGAGSPSGANVLLINITQEVSPATTRVAGDGSFALSIEAERGDSLRLVLLGEEGRSDVVLLHTILPSLVLPCVTLEPNAVDLMDSDDEAEAVLRNGCTEPVEVQVESTRSGAGTLRASPESAITVAPNESATLRVSGQVGTDEHALVFIQLRSGAAISQRVLSVFRER